MAEYLDGFVLPVPKDSVDAYRQGAQKAGEIWREYGAIDYKECVADDVAVGDVTSFPRSVELEDSETVVFAWITYESRAERDRINAAVMADDRVKTAMESSPVEMDMQRMVYGGFEVIVSE
jgi:uncharacterized protein YbaA (DUF1428 family)